MSMAQVSRRGNADSPRAVLTRRHPADAGCAVARPHHRPAWGLGVASVLIGVDAKTDTGPWPGWPGKFCGPRWPYVHKSGPRLH